MGLEAPVMATVAKTELSVPSMGDSVTARSAAVSARRSAASSRLRSRMEISVPG